MTPLGVVMLPAASATLAFSFQQNLGLGTFVILIATSVAAVFVGARNRSWRTSAEGWKSSYDQSQAELGEMRDKCHGLEVEVATLHTKTDVTAFAKEIEARVGQFDVGARERQEQILACFQEVGKSLQANTTALQGLALQLHATQ